MQMKVLALVVAVSGAGMMGAAPVRAAPAASDLALEISSQATTMQTNRRPRVRVYPRYYPRRPDVTLYPLPYGIDYPGPRAVRQCVSRLVPEHRPSGTVIVPRTRCWWTQR